MLVDDKLKLLVTVEHPEYTPTIHSSCWVDVNIEAPAYEEDENENIRVPIDVVAVIDRSRSMGGSKFHLLKNSFRFIVNQLTSKDRLYFIVDGRVIEVVFHDRGPV